MNWIPWKNLEIDPTKREQFAHVRTCEIQIGGSMFPEGENDNYSTKDTIFSELIL